MRASRPASRDRFSKAYGPSGRRLGSACCAQIRDTPPSSGMTQKVAGLQGIVWPGSQLLRCQYLYFCTSKASKLSTGAGPLQHYDFPRRTHSKHSSLECNVSATNTHTHTHTYNTHTLIRERFQCTIFAIDYRNQESAQIPGFSNQW